MPNTSALAASLYRLHDSDTPVGTLETMPRRLLTQANNAIANGTFNFSFFTAARSMTVGNLKTITGATAAAATPTLCQMALYTVDPVTGAVTLLGNTANDTTLFAATKTAYTRALTAPVAVSAGQRLAFSIGIATAVAGPTFLSTISGLWPSAELAALPRVCGRFFSGSVPPSLTDSQFLATDFAFYGALLP